MTSFLCDLISIRSVCGIDNERLVAERICIECQKLQLKYDIIAAPDQEDRPNVIVTAGMNSFDDDVYHFYTSEFICRLYLGDGPSKFLFIGHMDTVNVEDDKQWSCAPFTGVIDEKLERVIGRGACDNKGGIVCALYTLHLLQQFINGLNR